MGVGTIAWIEDDIDLLDAVVQPLRSEGFAILECRTYSKALDMIHALKKCDLILLDLILPPGNSDEKGEHLGLLLLQQFREQFRFEMPILVFSVVAHSAEVMPQDTLSRFNAQAIAKPIRPSILKQEIMDILQKYRK